MNKGSESKLIHGTMLFKLSNANGCIIYRSNIKEISRNQNDCPQYNSFNEPIQEK